jgi:hypothetical protein
MKILAIGFVYNERPYIPEIVKYYTKQGCEVYIIDNYSNDGTYEYLVENKVNCSRLDTNETFDLVALQKETDRLIHKIKPDWIVYIAGDLFHICGKPIKEAIEEADKNDFTQISSKCYNMLNIGEKFKIPLYKNYYHGEYYMRLQMITKYNENINVVCDSFKDDNPVIYESDYLIVNYGGCKPAQEQEIKLERRKKAWENGLRKGIGRHFLRAQKHNWIWPRKSIKAITNWPKEDYELIHNFIIEN